MPTEIDANKSSKQNIKREKARKSTKPKIRDRKRQKTFKNFLNSTQITQLINNRSEEMGQHVREKIRKLDEFSEQNKPANLMRLEPGVKQKSQDLYVFIKSLLKLRVDGDQQNNPHLLNKNPFKNLMNKFPRASKNTPRIQAFHQQSDDLANSNNKQRFLSDSPIEVDLFKNKRFSNNQEKCFSGPKPSYEQKNDSIFRFNKMMSDENQQHQREDRFQFKQKFKMSSQNNPQFPLNRLQSDLSIENPPMQRKFGGSKEGQSMLTNEKLDEQSLLPLSTPDKLLKSKTMDLRKFSFIKPPIKEDQKSQQQPQIQSSQLRSNLAKERKSSHNKSVRFSDIVHSISDSSSSYINDSKNRSSKFIKPRSYTPFKNPQFQMKISQEKQQGIDLNPCIRPLNKMLKNDQLQQTSSQNFSQPLENTNQCHQYPPPPLKQMHIQPNAYKHPSTLKINQSFCQQFPTPLAQNDSFMIRRQIQEKKVDEIRQIFKNLQILNIEFRENNCEYILDACIEPQRAWEYVPQSYQNSPSFEVIIIGCAKKSIKMHKMNQDVLSIGHGYSFAVKKGQGFELRNHSFKFPCQMKIILF